ncbi:MAG: DUF255 domain-containing protein [Cyclobacteriaceae bacterium]
MLKLNKISLLLTVVAVSIVAIMSSFTFSETEDIKSEKVQWLTFEEAVAKNKIEPRKVFVDVYTDWCGWCKKMDANTFNHPVVAKYLNEKYYPVKLDAEGKEPIEFDGHTFKWVNTGRNGIHELAYALLNGKMSYPTVVFLNEEMQILQPLPGYQKAPFFDKVIKFYGENAHKNKSWDEFLNGYDSPLE